MKEVQLMAKSLRPVDPSDSKYLPQSYINAHLQKFERGATRFQLKTRLDKYGPGQSDGTSFVMPKSEADKLISATKGGDTNALADALGIPRDQQQGDVLMRVDFNNPSALNLRMPSGREAGANSQWLPGGKLPDGNSEAVIDVGSASSSVYTAKPVF